jgi:hypothetical protein
VSLVRYSSSCWVPVLGLAILAVAAAIIMIGGRS